MNSELKENPIQVVRYEPSMKGMWDAFVKASKNGTFLFLRDYMDYHADRFADFSLLFYKGKKLVGLLPANCKGDELFSHGGLTYGGLVLNETSTIELVMDMFVAMRGYLEASSSVSRIIYRPVPAIYHTYASEEDLYALFRYRAVLTERRISSVVWQEQPYAFSKLRQRKLKQALKAGLKICEDADYARFWPVLEANLQQRHDASPVHALAEIQMLAQRFPDQIKLYRVENSEGQTVGGTVMFLTPKVARVQYIGSTEEGRSQGALDFLFDDLVHRRLRNHPFFDFGTSVEDGGRYLNKGLIFQKEGFGGRALVYDAYELQLKKISNG